LFDSTITAASTSCISSNQPHKVGFHYYARNATQRTQRNPKRVRVYTVYTVPHYASESLQGQDK